MKTRSGFVSNSSSTSFIIGVQDATEIVLHIRVDLSQYANEVIESKEALDAYFEEIYWQYGERDEYVQNEYDRCIASLNEGNKILVGNFYTDDGDDLAAFLCNHGIPETPGIDIIHSEEGF